MKKYLSGRIVFLIAIRVFSPTGMITYQSGSQSVESFHSAWISFAGGPEKLQKRSLAEIINVMQRLYKDEWRFAVGNS